MNFKRQAFGSPSIVGSKMYNSSPPRHHNQGKTWFWRNILLFCRAKDFQSLMFPCFALCLILGTFPYACTSAGSLTASAKGYIYCTIVTLVYLGYMGVIIYQVDISQILKFDTIPALLQANCYLLLGASMSITVYVMHTQRMAFLQQLQELASRLPVHSFKRMSRVIHPKDFLGFCFIFGQVSRVPSHNIYLTAFKVVALYIALTIFIMDMLYVNCVGILSASFHKVNKDLTSIKELLVKDEPHLLRRVYHKQRNPLLLMELRGIKKHHMLVSDALQRLNEVFSMQLVVTTVLTFAEVTFSLYFYILSVCGSTNINLEKQIWYSYFVTSIAYFCTKIMIMVWACENARLQALSIGTSIHEVLSNTADVDVKNELQLFALQVLQRKNTFCSKGLTMDATLISTIIGNIITYLLILIQFLLITGKASRDNNEEPQEAEHD